MGMGVVDCHEEGEMSELVARTGRLRQRYLNGCRLVAGYRSSPNCNGASTGQNVEVLMITSASGPGLLFPKGGWEDDESVQQAAVREAMEEAGVKGDLMASLGVYDFKSRTLQDEFCPEGLCKAEMFALFVQEEMQTWPEHSTRKRSWLTIPEALGCCRHPWMRKALEDGFIKWHTKQGNNEREEEGEEVELPAFSAE
ncbi:hypothetical protein V2J09_016025 [Rumex salicifolius]